MFNAVPPAGPAPDPLASIDYDGDPAQRAPLVEALRQVVDPEMAMNIVDLGLVYALSYAPAQVVVTVTMTSAACPVADMIMAEIEDALDRVLPRSCEIDIELVFDPPWSPARMSARARRAFGWDEAEGGGAAGAD